MQYPMVVPFVLSILLAQSRSSDIRGLTGGHARRRQPGVEQANQAKEAKAGSWGEPETVVEMGGNKDKQRVIDKFVLLAFFFSFFCYGVKCVYLYLDPGCICRPLSLNVVYKNGSRVLNLTCPKFFCERVTRHAARYLHASG
jgi:hypothetical protein